METIECIVVGAGLIGLAIARRLALAGREVLVIERAEAVGTETSSRHSEVIHAGIYYRPGSLMARLCVAGRKALYRYCRDRDVPFRRIDKLIVATSKDDVAKLDEIRCRAMANGVTDLQLLTGGEARALEPELECRAALLSRSTEIIDSHRYLLALQGDLETAGGALALRTAVCGARVADAGFIVSTAGADAMQLRCTTLINAAGLWAPAFAARIEGLAPAFVPTPHFAKGSYFTLTAKSPFTRLVYPVPEPGGLGVHLTLDMAGQARFGPDVEWVDAPNYDVEPARAERFYAGIRRYWPALPDRALVPAYAGIRPKIVPPSVAVQDFVIQTSADHGVPGLINLFGIESPGMTASLAIADYLLAPQLAQGCILQNNNRRCKRPPRQISRGL